ncbi:MAG: type II secretion system F family protein [Synergistaceae bacterium]|nr:type II secretion system F family protein [Synergistaceae bacterium]MBR0253680.1 type II secretion system F family protein [Synergistaceae bacterium]MBR0316558.1 type II secretion system F family protein [Synergistaceae bacterium]
MPYFNYSGYDAKGKNTKGTIEAGSSIQAVDRLTERGIVVVDIKVAEEKKGNVKIKLMPLEQHIFFCRSIASYLKSGLPLADALRIMSKQTRDKIMKPVMEKLLAEVEGGRKFHTALAESGAFRESLWRVAESGEQSGTLISVLNEAADEFKLEDDLRRKIRGAMTYPIVMAVVGVGVVAFMLTYVVPKISELFEDMNQTLPLPTRILIGMSEFLSSYGFWILIALAVLFIYMKKTGKSFTFPGMKGIRDQLNLALVMSHISTLLKSGIPLVSALKMASSMDVHKQRWLDAAEMVKSGYKFEKALEKIGMPEDTVAVVRVGEMGSDLSGALTNISEQCREVAQSKMEKLSTLMEPIMVLSLGVSVGFIVLAILTPVFDLAGIVK